MSEPSDPKPPSAWANWKPAAAPCRDTEQLSEHGARPLFATVNDWCRLSGMGRTSTYYALSRGDLRAIKLGRRVLIDCEHGVAWLRSRPLAVIKPYERRA